MSPSLATLISSGVVIVFNLLTAAFIYGQLTQRVKGHGGRIEKMENIVSGPGGHGERITRLEGPRLRPDPQHGD